MELQKKKKKIDKAPQVIAPFSMVSHWKDGIESNKYEADSSQ